MLLLLRGRPPLPHSCWPTSDMLSKILARSVGEWIHSMHAYTRYALRRWILVFVLLSGGIPLRVSAQTYSQFNNGASPSTKSGAIELET